MYELEQGRDSEIFCEVFCPELYPIWLLSIILFLRTRDLKFKILKKITNKNFEVILLCQLMYWKSIFWNVLAHERVEMVQEIMGNDNHCLVIIFF